MIQQASALPEVGNIYILANIMNKKFDYIQVTSKNLRRIREQHNLTQPELAVKIGSTAGRISAYETGADAMGTDYIERVCKALEDVEFWEFVIDENTPIVKDEREQERIRLYRIEERLGIADQVREQEEIWIERAQKKSGVTTEVKNKRDTGLKDLKARARKQLGKLTEWSGKKEREHEEKSIHTPKTKKRAS